VADRVSLQSLKATSAHKRLSSVKGEQFENAIVVEGPGAERITAVYYSFKVPELLDNIAANYYI